MEVETSITEDVSHLEARETVGVHYTFVAIVICRQSWSPDWQRAETGASSAEVFFDEAVDRNLIVAVPARRVGGTDSSVHVLGMRAHLCWRGPADFGAGARVGFEDW